MSHCLLSSYSNRGKPEMTSTCCAATTCSQHLVTQPDSSGFSYVHLAVFDAVNAFDHRFQPYVFTTNPPPGANKDAAAVAAAHWILVNCFLSQQTTLDTAFNA